VWGVGVLLGFGAGIALGMLLTPGDRRPPPAPVQTPTETLAAVAPAETPKRVETPRIEPDGTPDRPAEQPAHVFNDPPPAADPLLAALRAIELAPLASGDGVITGKVQTLDGEPVAGVTVQLAPPPNQRNVNPWYRPGDNPDPWEALPGEVRDFVRYRLATRPPQLAAVTDSSGMFRISGLADMGYYLSASLEDFDFDYRDGRNRYEPGADTLIWAIPAIEVRIRIEPVAGVDQDGLSVTHRVLSEGAWDRPLTNPVDGVWTARVRPGMHVFTAVINEPRTPGEPYLLHVKKDMPPQELTLKVGVVSRISGRVEFSEGKPMRGLYVVCVPLEPGVDMNVTLETAVRANQGRSTVTSEGLFNYPVMPPGDYAMALTFSGAVIDPRQVSHAVGGTVVNFSLSPPDPSECIVCVVSTHDGRALGSPYFRIRSLDGNRSSTCMAWEMAPGEYRITPPKNPPPLPAELFVQDGTRGSATVPLASLGPQRISVEFGPQSTLVLRWGGSNQPDQRRNLTIALYDEQGRAVLTRSMGNWVGNIFALPNVPVGSLRMEISVGRGASGILLINQSVSVPVEGTIVELSPPPLYEVTITAPEGERTQLKLEGEFAGKSFTRTVYYNNRPTKISSLPAGRYTIRWRSRGTREDKTQYIDVPGAGTINLG
jgi:hypothetical protein